MPIAECENAEVPVLELSAAAPRPPKRTALAGAVGRVGRHYNEGESLAQLLLPPSVGDYVSVDNLVRAWAYGASSDANCLCPALGVG